MYASLEQLNFFYKFPEVSTHFVLSELACFWHCSMPTPKLLISSLDNILALGHLLKLVLKLTTHVKRRTDDVYSVHFSLRRQFHFFYFDFFLIFHCFMFGFITLLSRIPVLFCLLELLGYISKTCLFSSKFVDLDPLNFLYIYWS